LIASHEGIDTSRAWRAVQGSMFKSSRFEAVKKRSRSSCEQLNVINTLMRTISRVD